MDISQLVCCKPHELPCWASVSRKTNWKHADPELIFAPEERAPAASEFQGAEPVSTSPQSFETHATASSAMDAQLGNLGGRPAELRQDLCQVHDRRCGDGLPNAGVATSSTSSRASGTTRSLPSRVDKKVWERARPVCKVPSVH